MPDQKSSRANLFAFALAGVLVAVAGGVGGWILGTQGIGGKAATERVVRDYILENPEILPEAMERLRADQTRKQLSAVSDEVTRAFPGAVLGNPNGTVTLVEFSDYACGFCRQSAADVEALIAANPDLKVVVRELPILSPESATAARMALAAAAQGKYAAFHNALFAAGKPTEAALAQAAQTAGLDMARARASFADPAIAAEIESNLNLASQLGFNGTPSWVVGDTVLSGAVGKDELARAIAAARR